jgi:hypothetical protein
VVIEFFPPKRPNLAQRVVPVREVAVAALQASELPLRAESLAKQLA